jgi:hypothetical protein
MFSNNGIASEAYEKIWETCMPVVNSNNAINSSLISLPTVQISLEIVTLFEKINDGEPILTVTSLKYRCFC